MTNAKLNIRMPGSVEFFDGFTDLPSVEDALEGTLYITRFDGEGLETTAMYEFVNGAYHALDLSNFDEASLDGLISQVGENKTNIEAHNAAMITLQEALDALVLGLETVEVEIAETKDDLELHSGSLISVGEVHGLQFNEGKLLIRVGEKVIEFEAGNGGNAVDLDEVQVLIDAAMSNHENKTIFKDSVHGFQIDGGIAEYWDHNKQEWVELFASEFQSYPRVKNLQSASNETGETIDITFENPVSPTYKKTEVYISESDITSSDRGDLAAIATLVIDDGVTTTYAHASTRNKTYFIMAYAVHEAGGELHYSSARSTSVQALDTKPPEDVTGIEVTPLDSALSISWVNPTDVDLIKVRGVYKMGVTPTGADDGIMFTDGLETTKVISGLTNGETYHFRFFTFDLSGNVNDGALMIASGTPSDMPVSATGPGPSELIAGTTEQGYYGRVPASELFTGTELSALVGITQGTIQHNATDWLKFAYEGKTLFRPMKGFRHSISWDHIHSKGCVFGTETVEKEGDSFKVRLMKGALTNLSKSADPDRGAKGSEWNKLMLPIHEKAANKSWVYPAYVEGDIPNWGIGFTDADLLTHNSAGNGSYSWCQETTASSANRVIRGYNGVSNAYWGSSSNASAYCGWAPVLELL